MISNFLRRMNNKFEGYILRKELGKAHQLSESSNSVKQILQIILSLVPRTKEGALPTTIHSDYVLIGYLFRVAYEHLYLSSDKDPRLTMSRALSIMSESLQMPMGAIESILNLDVEEIQAQLLKGNKMAERAIDTDPCFAAELAAHIKSQYTRWP